MTDIINTSIDNFTIRTATDQDVDLILSFIQDLAEYEKMLDAVVATREILHESLFEKKVAEVVIGEYMGEPVAFALFFHNFSTFMGKPGIYLEDLYVKPEVRGRGIGQVLLSYLAKLCVDRNCGRFEWSCLDWNEPSLAFYEKMGAEALDEWIIHRVSGEKLTQLAEKF